MTEVVCTVKKFLKFQKDETELKSAVKTFHTFQIEVVKIKISELKLFLRSREAASYLRVGLSTCFCQILKLRLAVTSPGGVASAMNEELSGEFSRFYNEYIQSVNGGKDHN